MRQIALRIADFELWIVGLAIAVSIVKPHFLGFAVLVSAVFWIVRWIAYHRLSMRTPVDIPIIYLLLLIPVTLWATAFPDETELQVLRLISGIALFYAIVNWCNSERRYVFIYTILLLGGLLLALLSPFSVEWPLDKLSFIPSSIYERFKLLVADTAHPNVMAGSLIILFPMALANILFSWKEISWFARLVSASTVLLIPIILALTQSRGAWLALIVILMIMAILRFSWGWIIVALSGIGAVIGINFLGIEQVLDIISSSQTVSGMDGRLEVWSRAVYMIQDFSFTGIGMGSFGEVANLLYPFFLFTEGSIPHAHNLFLQIAVDLGLLGLIAWLAALMGVLVIAWQLFKLGGERGDALVKGIGAGFVCSQVALIVHGFLDAVTWGMVRPAPLVWAIWGTCIAAWYIFIQHRGNYEER